MVIVASHVVRIDGPTWLFVSVACLGGVLGSVAWLWIIFVGSRR